MDANSQCHYWQSDLVVRPSPDQPSTYEQQVQIIDLVASDPTRHDDFHGARRMGRRLVLPHVRYRAIDSDDIEPAGHG